MTNQTVLANSCICTSVHTCILHGLLICSSRNAQNALMYSSIFRVGRNLANNNNMEISDLSLATGLALLFGSEVLILS